MKKDYKKKIIFSEPYIKIKFPKNKKIIDIWGIY